MAGFASMMGNAFSIQGFFVPVLKSYPRSQHYVKMLILAYVIGTCAYIYIAYMGSCGNNKLTKVCKDRLRDRKQRSWRQHDIAILYGWLVSETPLRNLFAASLFSLSRIPDSLQVLILKIKETILLFIWTERNREETDQLDRTPLFCIGCWHLSLGRHVGG